MCHVCAFDVGVCACDVGVCACVRVYGSLYTCEAAFLQCVA
jgi:hypothetical protein